MNTMWKARKLSALKDGETFIVDDVGYIKTNMIHHQTGERYCCNIKSGRMVIFPETEEVYTLGNGDSRYRRG